MKRLRSARWIPEGVEALVLLIGQFGMFLAGGKRVLKVGLTGTDTSTSAVTVVVALIAFPRRGIRGRERGIRLEALGDKVFGILPSSTVMIHSP